MPLRKTPSSSKTEKASVENYDIELNDFETLNNLENVVIYVIKLYISISLFLFVHWMVTYFMALALILIVIRVIIYNPVR